MTSSNVEDDDEDGETDSDEVDDITVTSTSSSSSWSYSRFTLETRGSNVYLKPFLLEFVFLTMFILFI